MRFLGSATPGYQTEQDLTWLSFMSLVLAFPFTPCLLHLRQNRIRDETVMLVAALVTQVYAALDARCS